MNRSDELHYDVASYALGILDDRDAQIFEDHLAGCQRCAIELEGILPVTSLLSEVDGETFVEMEEIVRDEHLLDEMVNAVTYERSRARAKQMFSLAAGVVALALVGGLAFLNIGGGSDSLPQALPSVSEAPRSDSESPLDGLAGVTPKRATDAGTKVEAAVRLADRVWGTDVALELRSVKGPLKCQLVAVRADGLGEVVTTWTVDKNGWGTNERREALKLRGGTAVKFDDIDRMEVQSVDSSGSTELLVAVDI
ncbi:zf-HC2 domain-containing protein [Pilimelia columellifera]|uniref:Anti-sigma U factor RsuA n=1 Tax=Pilimelia columellifera subsp. columellifera TaxID=706583 RepID=A0ABP6AAC2_9ACTN